MIDSTEVIAPAFSDEARKVECSGNLKTGRRCLQPEEAAALKAMLLFADYDCNRLQTYQRRENHGDRIAIGVLGSAMALRFDDVGYFNRVYAPNDLDDEQLRDVERFFDDALFSCVLIGTPQTSFGHTERRLQARGWLPGQHYAWLHAPTKELSEPKVSGLFTVVTPQVSERELFLRCYLQGFEAAPEARDAAVRNMRHLFTWPDLHFLIAWNGNQPAGICMLRQVGEAGLFCAGATLPGFRNSGCHAALLAARVRLARDLGIKNVYSWAFDNSQSQQNMALIGLRTCGVTKSWHFPSQR